MQQEIESYKDDFGHTVRVGTIVMFSSKYPWAFFGKVKRITSEYVYVEAYHPREGTVTIRKFAKGVVVPDKDFLLDIIKTNERVENESNH